jgi:hypothetical protein
MSPELVARMLAWLQRHYELEERWGKTDRPEYIELGQLLDDIKSEAFSDTTS